MYYSKNIEMMLGLSGNTGLKPNSRMHKVARRADEMKRCAISKPHLKEYR